MKRKIDYLITYGTAGLLVIQFLVQQIFGVAKYFDEIVAVMAGVYAVVTLLRGRKIEKCKLIAIGAILIFAIAGSLSSIILHYQPVALTVAGLFLSLKWWMLFIGAWLFIERRNTVTELDNYMRVYVYVLVIILFIWKLTSFIFGNNLPAHILCANTVFLVALLLMKWEDNALNYTALLMLVVLACWSFKAKGYALAVLTVGVFVMTRFFKKKLKWYHFTVLGAGAIIAAWKKIYYYYVEGVEREYTRPYMLQKSIEIAKDHFPIGTGWSTFGSWFSIGHYSPVYWLYDMGNHREVGFTHRMFLNDNYLASVIGETGFLGLLALAVFCIVLFIEIDKLWEYDWKFYAGGLTAFCYLLITFVEESGLQQPTLLCLALLFGLLLGKRTHKRNNEFDNRKEDRAYAKSE